MENELNISKGENEIRQLKPNILNYFNIAIFINFLSFYLSFYLFISFCVEKNECGTIGSYCIYCLCCQCYKCSHNNDYDDCYCYYCYYCNCQCERISDCECESVDGLIVFIIVLPVLIIIGIIYGTLFLAVICGKNLSRYIVFTIISFISLAILILCFLQIKNKELLLYIIMGVSGTIILLNILWMIFNNICQKKESQILLPIFADSKKEEGKSTTQGDNTTYCPETPYYEKNNNETPIN